MQLMTHAIRGMALTYLYGACNHIWGRTTGRSHCMGVLLVLVAVVVGTSSLAIAADVAVRFSLEQPEEGLFPSNLFTVPDASQLTGLRINMPLPNCDVQPSDCDELSLINTLDGFNLQPRLVIPFSGPIDVQTVTSATVFLLQLAESNISREAIGINQVVWDPETQTLYAESDALLEQHTSYALVLTQGVRDTSGDSVERSSVFDNFLSSQDTLPPDSSLRAYRDRVADVIAQVTMQSGDAPVAVSVFTTQSATALLEKLREQVRAGTPNPAVFQLGPEGFRTVFALSEIRDITFTQQIGTEPEAPESFRDTPVELNFLDVVPGAITTLAFGSYRAPKYLTAASIIPPVGTREGIPALQGDHELLFTLFLPTGEVPPTGWPVAIVGAGRSAGKHTSTSYRLAATIAAGGIATIIIDAVGHGGGPLGTLTVTRTAGDPVTFPAGGRGVDLDGDGQIGNFEGFFTDLLLFERDPIQQTVVDLMQLVRVIEVGMDIDGNGTPDLDPARIAYVGVSLGANYGIMLLAVDPVVRVGVFNVPGGPLAETLRLTGTGNRGFLEQLFATRIPPLTNIGTPGSDDLRFHDNLPLRNLPPVINDVPGAVPIQHVIERLEWLSQAGSPVAYASALRRQPLAGVAEKSVLIQFAQGDQNFPNPTTTAILRAGDLADVATFYRNDLAFNDPQRNPTGNEVPKNPHVFMLRITTPGVNDTALAAQQQMAAFLTSDGRTIIDPDGSEGELFEVPVVPPLPEDLDFIP